MGYAEQNERYELIQGDCIEVMRTFQENSFDTLICDPPSGTNFMGKNWDHHSRYAPQTDKGQCVLHALTLLQLEPWAAGFVAFTTDWAVEALRVLKPGAMGLVWALPRTSDLTGLGLRLAGFKVRDNVYHLFGSGFPKSHDISKAIDRAAGADREIIGKNQYANRGAGINGATFKYDGSTADRRGDITAPVTNAAQEWQGWGTALKPAVEEWILIQKPLEGTYAQNALAHGVAGLWIDGCRVETDGRPLKEIDPKPTDNNTYNGRMNGSLSGGSRHAGTTTQGRWPANLLLDQSAADTLDTQSGKLTSGKPSAGNTRTRDAIYGHFSERSLNGYADTGYASRFFTVLPDEQRFCYTAKASTNERNEGLDPIEAHQRDASRNAEQPSMNGGAGNPYNRGAAPVKNSHSTVKPISLMRWLVRLTKTPTGGKVLDPFVGSGTTIVACLLEGRHCTGIEREDEYIPIARHRADHWQEEASITPKVIKGSDKDIEGMPLFAGVE